MSLGVEPDYEEEERDWITGMFRRNLPLNSRGAVQVISYRKERCRRSGPRRGKRSGAETRAAGRLKAEGGGGKWERKRLIVGRGEEVKGGPAVAQGGAVRTEPEQY